MFGSETVSETDAMAAGWTGAGSVSVAAVGAGWETSTSAPGVSAAAAVVGCSTTASPVPGPDLGPTTRSMDPSTPSTTAETRTLPARPAMSTPSWSTVATPESSTRQTTVDADTEAPSPSSAVALSRTVSPARTAPDGGTTATEATDAAPSIPTGFAGGPSASTPAGSVADPSFVPESCCQATTPKTGNAKPPRTISHRGIPPEAAAARASVIVRLTVASTPSTLAVISTSPTLLTVTAPVGATEASAGSLELHLKRRWSSSASASSAVA